MKFVDKYKLTRKLAKLEKLYIENASDTDSTTSGSTRATRSGKSTANIFSKNLANVKAAVEAGQDVNQTNDKGLTPLALACKSKVMMSGIAEYLLDHGANANDVVDNQRKPVLFAVLDKGDLKSASSLVEHGANLMVHYNHKSAIEYALRYCEIKDATFLTILTHDGLSHFERICALNYLTGNRSTMFGNVDTLISKLLDVDDSVDFVWQLYYNADITTDDLHTGNGVVFDKIVSYGYLPYVIAFKIKLLGTSTINKIYNAIKLARDGKLDYSYISDFNLLIKMCDSVCDALNVVPIAYDLINVDFINNSNNRAVSKIIQYLISENKLEIIKKLAKGNLKRSDYAAQETIRALIYENLSYIDRARTAAVCRLLNKFMTRSSSIPVACIRELQITKDRFLLDYLFERDMGDLLTKTIYGMKLSNEFIDACKEHGFEIEEINKMQNQNGSKIRVLDIVKAIKDDTWNRELEAFVTENPRVLLSDEVQAALNDERNRGSVTRRQLLRKIEQLPAEQADVYDM
jgi:hypothetical protein